MAPWQASTLALQRRASTPPYRSIILALALLVAFIACKRSKPAEQSQGPLPVNFITAVEKEVTEWDEYTGRIEAMDMVEIRPRVQGYITDIKFKEGSNIKKNDLLFVIDRRPYQAVLDQATAEVERAEAQLKLAQIEVVRAQELRGKNAISASEFDQKAANQLVAAAALRSAQAAESAARLNLEFTEIRSPIDGRVSNERITLGNLVQPGGTDSSILTTVVSTDPFYVYIDADENSVLKYIKLDAEGRRVSARNRKLPVFAELANETGFPHEGVIDFVDNRLDPNTGTMRARGVFKSWSDLLTPGFFVRVRIPGAENYRAILVDDKVISSQQSVRYVFVIKPDKTVERRNVTTGPMFEGKRIVKSGLKDGEQVVSTRLQILQPGMPVQPVPEPKTETPVAEATSSSSSSSSSSSPP
jgi:RND family efflux transporter MFP subunit